MNDPINQSFFLPGYSPVRKKESWEAKPGSRLLPLSSNVGMELVKVEAGCFLMGSQEDDVERFENEIPQKKCIQKDFWIGKYPVTNEQYGVLSKNIVEPYCHFNNSWDAPVAYVSWDDAIEFCQKLTTQEEKLGRLPEGYIYSLPTEAQWEYAARGGNKSQGFKYSGSNNIKEVAIYGWEWGAAAVGTLAPNELGLYDMSGNVLEWCLDACSVGFRGGFHWFDFQEIQYVKTDEWFKQNPDKIKNEEGRIVRGGGYYFQKARQCRLTARYCSYHKYKDSVIGFRLALVPNQ